MKSFEFATAVDDKTEVRTKNDVAMTTPRKLKIMSLGVITIILLNYIPNIDARN